MKWVAVLLAYLTVGIGMLVFHSAWGALLGFHAAIILSLLITKPDVPIRILFTSTNKKWIFINILLCGSSGVALYFLWDTFRFANNFSQQVEALGLNASNWPIFIAYFVLVNPFLEEYFWRGYLGNESKSPQTSDFLFAGYHTLIVINKLHIFSITYALFVLLVAGWFWRQTTREDGGLLAPVLGHMAADLTILVTVYIMVIPITT